MPGADEGADRDAGCEAAGARAEPRRKDGRFHMYQLVEHYRDNDSLRHSFNELAGRTFGLDFEDWYQNGFWGDSYDPCSIVEDGRVVANVSVNRTDMVYEGRVRHLLQLGTVMTEESHRNRGLIRELMEHIGEEWRGKAEGTYLFANDSVLDFYPKFGFRRAAEYQYTKRMSGGGDCQFERVPMDSPAAWRRLEDAMEGNVFHGRFDMRGNKGLIMFYVTKFMRDNVYFHSGTDTFVIAEKDGGILLLHNVFSRTLDRLEDVEELFGKETEEVRLGFVPSKAEGYEASKLREEDCTFFVRGRGLDAFRKDRLRIPSLCHA